eukprot:2398144-Rhodomonas_salina.1
MTSPQAVAPTGRLCDSKLTVATLVLCAQWLRESSISPLSCCNRTVDAARRAFVIFSDTSVVDELLTSRMLIPVVPRSELIPATWGLERSTNLKSSMKAVRERCRSFRTTTFTNPSLTPVPIGDIS